MKYIRTTNGIYERELAVVSVCDNKEVSVIRYDKLEIEPIVKQADTIEELCDDIIRISLYHHKPNPFSIFGCCYFPFDSTEEQVEQVKKKEIDKQREEIKRGDNIEIYGAIWCEWGLKYVARMNSEGVFELL